MKCGLNATKSSQVRRNVGCRPTSSNCWAEVAERRSLTRQICKAPACHNKKTYPLLLAALSAAPLRQIPGPVRGRIVEYSQKSERVAAAIRAADAFGSAARNRFASLAGCC